MIVFDSNIFANLICDIADEYKVYDDSACGYIDNVAFGAKISEDGATCYIEIADESKRNEICDTIEEKANGFKQVVGVQANFAKFKENVIAVTFYSVAQSKRDFERYINRH